MQQKNRKRIFNISIFILIIFLAVLIGLIPTKSQLLVLPEGTKRYFTYDSFLKDLARHVPIGSTEKQVITFWESQKIKNSYIKVDKGNLSDSQNSEFILIYHFEKLFSQSCFLSKSGGNGERMGYSFNDEGKLVSVSYSTACGFRAYN